MAIERWRTCLSVILLATLTVLTSGCANSLPRRAARPQPVDMRLLQFLGSADPTSGTKRADGASWMAYLSELKMDKVAKATREHASRPAHKCVTEPHTCVVGSR